MTKLTAGQGRKGEKKDFEIPKDYFDFDGDRPKWWPDHPDVRRAVEWLRGYIEPAEWRQRPLAAAQRVYQLVINGAAPGTTGKLFDARGSFVYTTNDR